MGFEHIIGNTKIKNLLNTTISHNNISHSYMFIGEDGIGKSLFAKEFAKSILCSSSSAQKPCNNCDSCLRFDSNNHPDFLMLDKQDEKNIKVEQIRFLQEKISEKPINSDKKVYIMNNSDSMTREAQNCLLKTLEEPPSYAVLILVLSNENKLLNTIKSRCTKVAFRPLTDEEMLQYLHHTYPEEEFNKNILSSCHGSIGKATKLKNQISLYQSIDTILEDIETKNIIDVWNNSETLYQSKDNIYDLLEYMNVILIGQLTKNYQLKYANCINIVEEAKSKLLSNANYDMTIDCLLMNLWEELHEKNSRN